MAKIGFIGLGTMGSGMVRNLLQAGHQVRVFNRTADRIDPLVEAGAQAAESVADAATGAEFVMYCLSNDAAVEAVALGEAGAIVNADPGALVIDLSTISPGLGAREHEAAAERGVRFLDAPVFGSKGEAANGGLWIVVGGAKEDFEAARAVLEPISETLHYMGPATSGNKMKLVGNLCVGAQLQSLGDALTLAAKAGLNPADVVGVLDVTDFKTPIYAGVGRAVIAGDYDPAFALKLLVKDLGLMQDFASEVGVDLPVVGITKGLAEQGLAAGLGERNASAVIKVISDNAGVDLAADPSAAGE